MNAHKLAGYKHLGTTNGWQTIMLDGDGNVTTDPAKYRAHGGFAGQPEYSRCDGQRHSPRIIERIGCFATLACDECKIIWSVDSSD